MAVPEVGSFSFLPRVLLRESFVFRVTDERASERASEDRGGLKSLFSAKKRNGKGTCAEVLKERGRKEDANNAASTFHPPNANEHLFSLRMHLADAPLEGREEGGDITHSRYRLTHCRSTDGSNATAVVVDALTLTVTYGDGQSRSALSSVPFGPKVSLTPIPPFLRFHQLEMIPAHLTSITDPHVTSSSVSREFGSRSAGAGTAWAYHCQGKGWTGRANTGESSVHLRIPDLFTRRFHFTAALQFVAVWYGLFKSKRPLCVACSRAHTSRHVLALSLSLSPSPLFSLQMTAHLNTTRVRLHIAALVALS